MLLSCQSSTAWTLYARDVFRFHFFYPTAEDPTLPTPFRPMRLKMQIPFALRIGFLFVVCHYLPRSFLSCFACCVGLSYRRMTFGGFYLVYIDSTQNQDGSRRQLYHHNQTA